MGTIKNDDLPEREDDMAVDDEAAGEVTGGALRSKDAMEPRSMLGKGGIKGFGETTGDSPNGF